MLHDRFSYRLRTSVVHHRVLDVEEVRLNLLVAVRCLALLRMRASVHKQAKVSMIYPCPTHLALFTKENALQLLVYLLRS